MRRIAILGLGAMGQRMAQRLLDAGYDVVAWNRSDVAQRAPRLVERLRESPRAAAADAELIISMVTDDAASRDVWEHPQTGALAALRGGMIAIESSTLTPSWVAKLDQQVTAKGAQFLDAPVVGSRPQAEAGTLVHLIGGAACTIEAARPVLSILGGALHHVGPAASGAMMKLVVNALFGVQVALCGELLGLARRAQLDVKQALDVLATLPVLSPSAKVAATAMLTERFEPLFPIQLVEKDFRYALAAGAAVGSALPVTERVADVFREALAAGLGAANLTAVAKLYS